MESLDTLFNASEVAKILKEVSSIAVIGFSPKESRPSHMVGKYLIDAGYDVYPVNPGQDEIVGRTCYKSVSDIPHIVDIVDIFRKSEDVLGVVQEVLRLEPLPKVIWMQQGIINTEAATLARDKGVLVVMDRCLKVDHATYVIK